MEDDNKIEEALFSEGRGNDRARLFEQYRVYLELADKTSERRQHANSFCLGISAALFASIGYLYSKDCEKAIRGIAIFIPLAGIITSIFWIGLVTSYRQLNSAKFRIIHHLEKRLEASPYHAEWIALGEGRSPRKYFPLTHIEIWIPGTILLAHIILLFIIP
jgi:hypothetical protein